MRATIVNQMVGVVDLRVLLGLTDDETASMLCHAKGLLGWNLKHQVRRCVGCIDVSVALVLRKLRQAHSGRRGWHEAHVCSVRHWCDVSLVLPTVW
jgi:hypothetical protein